MQHHMPIGYKVIEGEIKIIVQEAQIVKRIFKEYVEGKALIQISKDLIKDEIKNKKGKTSWTHVVVGNILKNHKYIGGDDFEPIIDSEMFEQAAIRRAEYQTLYSRKPGYGGRTNSCPMSKKLFCGKCGAHYIHYSKSGKGRKTTQSYWGCSRYLVDNKVCCRSPNITEERFMKMFRTVIERILSNQELLHREIKPKEISASPGLVKINQEIFRLENCRDTNREELADLYHEMAQIKYNLATVDDYNYQTTILMEIINNKKGLSEYDGDVFRKAVKKVEIIQIEKINFEFINGVHVLADLKKNE